MYGCEQREREDMKTEQRANRTNMVERVGERLVYKSCWNTLKTGKTMRCSRGRIASKRIRGRKPSRDQRYVRGRSADKPRIAKRTKVEELCADRDFLRSAIYTVGGDGSERKGNFLDGGSYVRVFFVEFRSGLGNLLGEISWYVMATHGHTDL